MEILKGYFKFRSDCLQADKTLRKQYKKKSLQKRKTQFASHNKKKAGRFESVSESDDEHLYQLKGKNSNRSISPPLLESFNTVMNQKSEVDKKFDRVEDELRKVFEETEAENIIIHVENDEDAAARKVATLTELKLPIVIKPLSPRKTLLKSKKSILGSSKLGQATSNVSRSSSGEDFKSNVGIYEGIPCSYVFDSEFSMVDGYLFEYRLCKGNLR